MSLAIVLSDALDEPRLRHAFFTRQGGVSTGVYHSLNGGVGSRDLPDAVAENRRRMAAVLGVEPARLVVPYQVHSAEALVVEAPFPPEQRPRVDGVVTRTPGLALGVTGADCGIVLLADAAAGVIGAVHAGWKGALTGVLEATVAAMTGLGAGRETITAVLGPTIAQPSYEVGAEFVARFSDVDERYGRFFNPATRPDHALFDLHGFIGHRLTAAGVGRFVDLELDTYADEARFFSYRRTTHRGEADYGRLVAAIVLAN